MCDTVKARPEEPVATVRECAGCHTVVYTHVDHTTPWMDTWFCDLCLRTLPAAVIEQLADEVALRGVPWS